MKSMFKTKIPIMKNLVPKRGSNQRKALATRSIEKNLEPIFSIVTPQYWCQNDRTDESF